MILPPEKIRRLLNAAIKEAYPDLGAVMIDVGPTTDEKHGDYASNIALKLGPIVHQPAIEIAQHIVAQIGMVGMLDKATIAGPGFINFFLKKSWLLQQTLSAVADKKFGQNLSGKNEKMLVEFISANPTGPMTLGNGRGGFAGDTLANVMTMSGWRVTREFYLNDIGNQVDILAESVLRRYFQDHGIPTEYPEHLYQGEYISDLAKKMKIDKLKLQDMRTVQGRVKGRVLNAMIADIQRVVTKIMGIKFDSWIRESALMDKKLDDKVLVVLRSHDLVYTKDDAIWFRTTAFGDDKDRVLVKADGEKTYFLSDIALRWQRFSQRGFMREVIYLGADHHGYVGRLKAAMAALGYAGRLDAQIVQLVRLMRGGQEVKMSKRAGTYITIEELINEVGADVARFFFLMHGANTHMDFDLDVAKEKSEKNPVFYVQYAGARMSSILKKTAKLKVKTGKPEPHTTEAALSKTLLRFPDLIEEISRNYETQKLPFYAIDLATKFHDFYAQCRVIDNDLVWPHRLALVKASRMVLEKTLGVMGVSAPEKM